MSVKMDELWALIGTLREYRECFPKTWLHVDLTDPVSPYRLQDGASRQGPLEGR